MNKGVLISGIILVGVSAFALINLISNYSTGNELDVSLLRETTENAMLDAVDLSYYRITGEVRMDSEKFVEVFTRRFAENVNNDRNYKIRIYDVNETPPKVSIQVGSSTSVTFTGEAFDIKNRISGILETTYQEDRLVEDALKDAE